MPTCEWGCTSHTADSAQHLLPLPWPELQKAVAENAARITELARAIADIDNDPLRAREWRAGERAYLEGKLAEREEAADELSELIEDAEFALDRISEFLQKGD